MSTKSSWRVAAIVALLAGSASTAAAQQRSDGFSPLVVASLTVSNSIAQAALALGEYRVQKDRVAGALAVARDDYWRRYPDGAGIEAAAQAYAIALRDKDIMLLAEMQAMALARDIGPRTVGPNPYETLIGLASQLSGGAVDGGLHPFAQPAFARWFSEAASTSPLGSDAYNDKLNSAMPEYRRYVADRNYAEYLYKSQVSPLQATDPQIWFAAVLAATHFSNNYDGIKNLVADLVRSVGEPRFNLALERLRSRDAVDHMIDKDIAGDTVNYTWAVFRVELELSPPSCHYLDAYDPYYSDVTDVQAAARTFKLVDECGSHGIDYVIRGYEALSSIDQGKSGVQRLLVFRDGSGKYFVAGREQSGFIVYPIPVAIRGGIIEADLAEDAPAFRLFQLVNKRQTLSNLDARLAAAKNIAAVVWTAD